MTSLLHLAHGFSLPAEEFLESATAIVGKRGRGKSGAVKRILEELHRNHLPFVVFDPAGVHWGIKSSGDGKGPGLDVMVIGGKHGDLRLERRAGAEVCRAVCAANISCVIDFKSEPKAAYRQFITDFAHELFRIDAPPRIIVIEEAARLIPQKLYPGMQECYEAVEKLVSQGRNEGLGTVVVGQRLATMAKDVVSEVDLLLIFGLVSPQDRKAVKEWVEVHDDLNKLAEFDAGIAGLQRQEAYAWAPERKLFRKVRILPFSTLHGDKTHLRKLGLLETKPVETDVSAVVAKLGEAMKRFAKDKVSASEAPKLAKQVADLKRQLEEERAKPKETGLTQSKVAEVEKPLRDELARKGAALDKANRRLQKVRDIGRELYLTEIDHLAPAPPLPAQGPIAEVPIRMPAPHLRSPVYRPDPAGEPIEGGGELHLRKGAVRMLTELASRHPLTLTRAQLATLTGFTATGGTFLTYLSQMKRASYLREDGNGGIHVELAGLDFVGNAPPPPSTHAEIMERWRQSLRVGNYRMLEVVVRHHPSPINRADLGAEAGFEPTAGTFGTYLSILRRNNLVTVDGDEVKASEALWP